MSHCPPTPSDNSDLLAMVYAKMVLLEERVAKMTELEERVAKMTELEERVAKMTELEERVVVLEQRVVVLEAHAKLAENFCFQCACTMTNTVTCSTPYCHNECCSGCGYPICAVCLLD